MPLRNHFRHQQYATPRPAELGRLMRAYRVSDPAARQARLAAIGQKLDAAGVAGIYLAHGTFVGEDALGAIRDLARVWPTAGELLKRLHKRTVDRMLGEAGNYTEGFAREMQEGLNSSFSQLRIPVRLFHWSSENNHLARVEAALRLIELLNGEALETGKRWLLWGHSHGGNVLALLTNLLGAEESVRERLFAAARSYFRWPWVGWIDRAVWPRVRELLRDPQLALRHEKLDLVTFGTPIRYGWDTGGYAKLLHFVHHRPVPGCAEHQCYFPPSMDDLLQARYGDYVQQLALAGTNLAPTLFQCGALLAEIRLGKILQSDLGLRNLLQNLKYGIRMSDEGQTMLVDYDGNPNSTKSDSRRSDSRRSDSSDSDPGNANSSRTEASSAQLAGHAVYTRLEWLPFHLEKTLEALYGETVS
ncbi:MAG: hypothetical protein RIS70_1820 [Planctomycetota bacterium]